MRADYVLELIDDFRRRLLEEADLDDAESCSDGQWISRHRHEEELAVLRRRVEIEAAKEALPREGVK